MKNPPSYHPCCSLKAWKIEVRPLTDIFGVFSPRVSLKIRGLRERLRRSSTIVDQLAVCFLV